MPKRIEDATIYRATVTIVLDKGYAGATMSMIADAAEVSELTLFRKYKSKAQLVAEAIQHSLCPLSDARFEPTGDLDADLDSIVRSFAAAGVSQSRLFGVTMTEIPRYPELADAVGGPNQVFGRMAALLAHYQRLGELREGDPLHLVLVLLGPLLVGSLLRHGNPELGLPPIDLAWHIDRFSTGHRS